MSVGTIEFSNPQGRIGPGFSRLFVNVDILSKSGWGEKEESEGEGA